ncbi:hypothetical protein ACJMK2_039893 [Sinanodonta woodiana]|uniref:Uncharacterized protein n=1 Tax=Sinanodonta woodiana TaxID=1069815 RepID=A0ABD3WEA4_SINWO
MIVWLFYVHRQNANASATSQSAGSKSTLQNLATLAEKQRLQTVRKVTDSLGLITETQGTNDLLTANEPPIQGCAIRKSSNFAVTGPSNLTRSHTDVRQDSVKMTIGPNHFLLNIKMS